MQDDFIPIHMGRVYRVKDYFYQVQRRASFIDESGSHSE